MAMKPNKKNVIGALKKEQPNIYSTCVHTTDQTVVPSKDWPDLVRWLFGRS